MRIDQDSTCFAVAATQCKDRHTLLQYTVTCTVNPIIYVFDTFKGKNKPMFLYSNYNQLLKTQNA